MRIVTGCRTPEQFVAAFHRFCDTKTCFIPTPDTRPVGRALAFSLRLVDGTPILRGTCVVKNVWTTKDNPFKRAGVELEIRTLSEDSAVLFDFMLSQKTTPIDDDERPTVQMAPVVPGEEEPQDDLAIPIENVAAVARDRARTILGVAPLKRPDAVPVPVRTGGTKPLVLVPRAPAAPSMMNLHAMTNTERYFVLCALGAALLVAAIVLASAYVFA